MIGYFIVTEFTGKDDAAGYKVQAKVKSKMNENILGVLWLPPHIRQGQSNIDVDSIVWGILDEVSGLGCAMMGIDDADFGYFYDADIVIKKKLDVDGSASLKDTLNVTKKATLSDALEVSKDITSTTGDVTATTISLKTHTHTIPALTVSGATPLPPAATPVTVAGSTAPPS